MTPLPLLLATVALSLLPLLVLMMTSFVRISVVLSILRSAIGAPQVPPTTVLTGLALVLTMAVMAPTAERMWQAAAPALETPRPGPGGAASGAGDLRTLEEVVGRAKEPLRE